jgi:hypothetical protein
MSFTVALVATHWTPTFENCRRSLHLYGYDYDVIGWNQKWEGFSWRIKLYKEYCLKQSGIIVFIDAYDVIAVRHSLDFFATYQAFKRPVVVGAEWWCSSKTNCGRVNKWWKDNNIKPSFRSKVNAGCLVGQSNQLSEMFSWILENNYQDDQLGLAAWINLFGKDTVALDSGSTLFYNANIFDGIKPQKHGFFHHFPGPLLKIGFMPLYNNTARKFLGTSARLQYPDTILETFVFAVFIMCLFSALHHVKTF